MAFDYTKLGLKAGLEVHQQLDTGKLFCRCPSKLRDGQPDFKVTRYIRAVASELGEFDKAALEAMQKRLTYIYEGYHDSTCLIELDEEPPLPVNGAALRAVFEVASMCDSNILDELFVMRKAVADGSNTSGFQRTMLVALGGKLKLKNKEVGVQSIALEEDAARPIEKREGEIVYRIDRLGIPLIEFATEPELFTPEEVKEAAIEVGTLMRRTCKMKRGLGTIRQDINISIAGGARVEIKGCQDLELMDEYVRREAQRQQSLLEIKNELQKRKIELAMLKSKTVELNSVFKNTECKFIRKDLDSKKVIGIRLEKFSGILGREIQPGRRFGSELANYVKVKAGLQGLLHSDELPAYGVSSDEVSNARKLLGCSEQDGFAFVVGDKEGAERALNVVAERCIQALHGIPNETRGALEGGNTEYQRPLPGAARMYPETDLETIVSDKKLLAQLGHNLPLTPEQRLELYTRKYRLSEKLAQEMKLSNYARMFEGLVERGHDPTKTAAFLLESLTQARRNGADIDAFSAEMLESFLDAMKRGSITKEVHLELIMEWGKKPHLGIEQLLGQRKMGMVSGSDVEKAVAGVISRNRKLVDEKGMHAMGALMGEAMRELKGRASGNQINEALKKGLEKAVKK